jgi:glycosidase
MGTKAAYDLWWKNAVIYCVDVELFADADGDGVGDFPGLTDKVDYLAGLGVTCIWLMPFYPTPNKDNGYDISDFYGVDPRLGTLGDFVEFLRAARERGIRVIADLVVNHTSDQHPWFQSARSDPASPFPDFYVWADEQPEGPKDVVFPDAEDSNWDYEEVAGKWFLHRFYSHMPDLNIASSRVRDEISKVVGYWLELGLSGFRVDAAPFVIEQTGTEAERLQDPHAFLRDLRAFLNRRRGDAILLAEANLPPSPPTRTCAASAVASAAASRPCWTATATAWSCSTAWRSPCPAARCCCTARRSASATTRPWRAAAPSGWPCSGPPAPTAASPPGSRPCRWSPTARSRPST